MSTLIQGQPTIIVVVTPGWTVGGAFEKLYKNGTSASVSDGTIIENGDDTVTVSFDGTDTDTVGDFTFTLQDAAHVRYFCAGSQVWTAPMGFIPNDGSTNLALGQLSLSGSTGIALAISGGSMGGPPAIQIDTGGDAIVVNSVGHGLTFNSDMDGIRMACGDACINLAGNQGILIEAVNFGIHVKALGTGSAMHLESVLGVGFDTYGAARGFSARNSLTGPPSFTTCAFYIGSANNGLVIASSSNHAVNIVGELAGVRLQGLTGPAVLWQGVNGLLAIADAVLNVVDGVDVGATVGWSLRVLLAAAAGKSSLTGAVRRYRDTNDTVDRVQATTDNFGQRTAVTYNA